jgi:hypothetical protein
VVVEAAYGRKRYAAQLGHVRVVQASVKHEQTQLVSEQSFLLVC